VEETIAEILSKKGRGQLLPRLPNHWVEKDTMTRLSPKTLGIKAREPGTEYGLGWFPINVLAHDPRGWPDNDRKERRLR
jgi:hypothetical protein